MAYYPQYPAFYAYPVPFPNQEFYALYPPNPAGHSGHIYYQDTAGNSNNMNVAASGIPYNNNMRAVDKFGYNNRKDSQDSGISELSDGSNSRKVSNSSTISNSSIAEEPGLDDVKEEDAPMVVPDDDLCVQIVQQVEFYFSDANITKDKFLLKHVKRNKDGFVSLKLISSFKRVKHLTKDWRQVAYAIERKSYKLEVNDVKTKVRRLETLPDYDETTPSRTVVAINLPLERPTIESVAEIFSVCGEIVLVRILRPGNPIPGDVRPFVNKHPEMLERVCALIEFERTEFAMKAVRTLNSEAEDHMKVMELTSPPPAKTNKKVEERRKLSLTRLPPVQQPQQPQRRYSQGMAPPALINSNSDISAQARRKISLFHNMKFSTIMEENKAASLNPNAPVFTMQQRRLSRPSQPSGPAFTVQPQSSAWMPRRISGQLDCAASGLTLPPNVIRQPRGPDGGKGFQRWCRSRMEPAANRKPSKAVDIVEPEADAEVEVEAVEQVIELAPDVEAPAIAVVEIDPIVINLDDLSSSSSEDEDQEGQESHFSDHDRLQPDFFSFENERSR